MVYVHGLGSASTAAITYGSATVCGIVAGEPTQRIQCYHNGGKPISLLPNISFEAISGGQSFFCGLRYGGSTLLCWGTDDVTGDWRSKPRRIYYNDTVSLTDLAVGADQVCAREVVSGVAKCWRGGRFRFPSPDVGLRFSTITSGSGFACGILKNNSRVFCWGSNAIGAEIETQFGDLLMLSLVAGESHACGLTRAGLLVCKGNNQSGQLDVPFSSPFEFSGLALGADFSCGVKRRNGLVVCWGAIRFDRFDYGFREDVSFESIIAGLDFVCGLTTRTLTMVCWGPGWSNEVIPHNDHLPLGHIIPGPCVQDSCSFCGVYPNSETLCDGSGNICRSCQSELPIALPLPPTPTQQEPNSTHSWSRKGSNWLSPTVLAVGSVGTFVGICSLVYCLWMGVCSFLHNKIYDSTQPTTRDDNVLVPAAATINNNNSVASALRSFSKRQSSRRLARQKSGSSSSSKQADKTRIFSLSELAAATNNFSLVNKIGSGSFGTVYKGKLADGIEVAIKRGEITAKRKKFQEKESAFDSELALLSRLHHKHLVGLIGFCQEKDERLLVYEYMSNGALHDHLHSRNNTEKTSSILNSWKMRIKIALDAARGIDYLHNYAVPPIIHRDIKSSNILLDANWTARVSDFGLSLLGPEPDQEFMSAKAVGTVGYIDPEYYVMNVLTSKSDVYGLGVVLLELLTGRKAVFKTEEDETGVMGVVEYASPKIFAGELLTLLDRRVVVPDKEAEAVEIMAYTALHCVRLEGKERPNVAEIVANLEKALALCEDDNASFSPRTLSFTSE